MGACVVGEREILGEDAEVFGVGDFGAPEFAGKVGTPNAAFGSIRLDYLEAGIMHVGAGIAGGAAGGDEGELGVQVSEPCQAQDVCQRGLQIGTGFEVHSVVEDDAQGGEFAEERGEAGGVVAIDEDVDDDAEIGGGAPHAAWAVAVELFGAWRGNGAVAADGAVARKGAERGGALGIVGVEVADAGHPGGVGAGGVADVAVVEAVESLRLDGADGSDSGGFDLFEQVFGRSFAAGRPERLGQGRIFLSVGRIDVGVGVND